MKEMNKSLSVLELKLHSTSAKRVNYDGRLLSIMRTWIYTLASDAYFEFLQDNSSNAFCCSQLEMLPFLYNFSTANATLVATAGSG